MDDSFSAIATAFDEDFDPQPGPSKVSKTDSTKTETQKINIGPVKSSTASYTILVNPKQRGNPILKAITGVPWEFQEIVPDYQMGRTVCALFLSLRYHNLNPDYIHERLKLLGNMFELRVLLVQVDVKEPHHLLKNLTRICILANLTLMLAWSPDEAGKIIETYKVYENKPADAIMGKTETTPYLKLVNALTTVRSINKTDAMNLIAKFSTLEGIIKASEFQISETPGIGPRKAKNLYQVLHSNFCKK